MPGSQEVEQRVYAGVWAKRGAKLARAEFQQKVLLKLWERVEELVAS